jgi:hypothetical protein
VPSSREVGDGGVVGILPHGEDPLNTNSTSLRSDQSAGKALHVSVTEGTVEAGRWTNTPKPITMGRTGPGSRLTLQADKRGHVQAILLILRRYPRTNPYLEVSGMGHEVLMRESDRVVANEQLGLLARCRQRVPAR